MHEQPKPWWEETEEETPNEFLNLTDLSKDEFLNKIGGAQPDKSGASGKSDDDGEVWDFEA